MSGYDYTISQAVGRKLIDMHTETNAHLTRVLSDEGQKISKELQSNGQDVHLDILTQGKYELHFKDSNKHLHEPISPINPQQSMIEWFFINSHATYYKSIDKQPIHPSPCPNDITLDYSTNSNPQKILVNVINDNPSLKISKNSKKSTHRHKKKRRIHTSSNTPIGSKTMEDLFHIVNKSAPSSMSERVIIIDRYGSNEKERLRVFDIHTSILSPMSPTTSYYNNPYQQSMGFMSMLSPMYSTFYAPSPYPFIYYSY